MPDLANWEERDYVKHPCIYLRWQIVDIEWNKDWICLRGYGKCPMCIRCDEYKENKDEQD